MTSIYLTKGERLTPPVCADNVDANGKVGVKAKLLWKSSDSKVAAVNSKGKITAKNPGKATITARALNGKSVKIKVTVVDKAVKLKKFTLTKSPESMKRGKAAILKLKLAPANATNLQVKFESSNERVLTVDKAGKLTALRKGTAEITVKIGAKKTVHTIKVK
jgi:uncharacterized protein YjdB